MVINDWLNITKVEGEGSQKVTLTTPLNEGEERSTTLIVSNGRKSKVVNIKQLKKSKEFKFEWFSKTFNNIPSTGSNADRVLTVFSCNAPCTLIRADIRNSEDYGMDFVTEETLEMTTGINNIYLNAESNVVNDVLQPVRMVVYIVLYKGEYQGTISIFQQGSTPTFTVTPNEVEFYKEGGTKTIEITANTNWRIGDNNFRPQITFSKTFGKSGTHTISVTAQEYEGVEDLIYNLWVGVESGISVPLVIKQVIVGIPQNCFYVEPLTAEGTTITPDGNVSYFQNGVWNELTASNSITITEKTYLKNFNKVNSNDGLKLVGSCNVGGNIETLLGEMKEDYAYNFFYECNIVDASNLILPSTTLAHSCYNSMFARCTLLTTAPVLPATTLAIGCYGFMFMGCESLTTTPVLPATTLADGCYLGMFDGCTSLVNAPSLPATTLGNSCYALMFANCSSLTTAPELPATIIAQQSYYHMFNDCSNLNYIKMLATTLYGVEGDNDFSLREWVDGVSPTGIFYKNPNMNDLPTGSSGIPSNWEVRDYEG